MLSSRSSVAAWTRLTTPAAPVVTDSLRDYGKHEMGRQIWMMAFFPKTQLAYPAFRVPFQSTGLSNHVSQWATALVR